LDVLWSFLGRYGFYWCDWRRVLLSDKPDQRVISEVETFDDFVDRVGLGLKHAFVARFGRLDGVEAASEAMAYAWEHWSRVSEMENPVGYLYRVGRSRTRRIRRRTPLLPEVVNSRMPEVEPRLPESLAALSERQRVAVILVHGLGWTQKEAAELLGVSRTTLQNHLERGTARLRNALEMPR
jgi:RNA polymerase sigma-70 factor (ECF subfamily)